MQWFEEPCFEVRVVELPIVKFNLIIRLLKIRFKIQLELIIAVVDLVIQNGNVIYDPKLAENCTVIGRKCSYTRD